MSRLLSTFLISALLLLSACAPGGGGGTETGNPGSKVPGPLVSDYTGNGGTDVLNTICTKLTACNAGLTATQCSNGLLPQTNIAARLGLASGFGTLQQVIDATNAETIVTNSTRLSTCRSDIEALSCGDPTVVAAWSSGSPSDFTAVFNLIPTSGTSCAGIY
jgi:hypothetical protein